MCGICGIAYVDRAHPVSERQLLAMNDALIHRGPDDAGHYVADGIGLGSRRLAILDLSPRGHMPMSRAQGRYWITYNGEVYNYRELRDELQSRGYIFRSNSDTEVVLALYQDRGPAMLDRLNGMFAFAIWDAERRSLFVARDRLGIKPLYYRLEKDALYFASEQKAIFAAGFSAEFEPDAWEELLCFRFVSGERTSFTNVKRLLPGHYLLFSEGRTVIRRWWHYADRVREHRAMPQPDAGGWFRETFDSAVALRRISDVPVGVLLSGGLDSGSVAASLAMAAGEGIASFTVRFDEPGYDESELALQVARKWKFDAHERTLTPADVVARVGRAAWLNDEPLAHVSDVHLGAIAEYARPIVTVLLSGEGADELLGGYVRYQPLRYASVLRAGRPLLAKLASTRVFGRRAEKLGRLLSLGSLRDFGIFNACEVLPGDLRALGMRTTGRFPFREAVWDQAEELYPGDLMRQAMFSDQHTFLCSLLDRNDRMTMGASIECRVPFLDYRLVEGVAALDSRILLAGHERKYLLRHAIAARLPAAVQMQRKWGFGVPWSRYLRGEGVLRDLVQSLPQLEPVRSGPFVRGRVAKVVSRFLAGDDDVAALVRQLVMIAVWYDACCGAAVPAAVENDRRIRDTSPGSDRPVPQSRIEWPPHVALVPPAGAQVQDL
jgi:asparagine synthase (glutamine-hydrolysing)